MTDPAKLIAIMKVMLSELKQVLSTAPEPTNEETDARTARLKSQIDRLKVLLGKHQDASRRKRELAKQKWTPFFGPRNAEFKLVFRVC